MWAVLTRAHHQKIERCSTQHSFFNTWLTLTKALVERRFFKRRVSAELSAAGEYHYSYIMAKTAKFWTLNITTIFTTLNISLNAQDERKKYRVRVERRSLFDKFTNALFGTPTVHPNYPNILKKCPKRAFYWLFMQNNLDKSGDPWPPGPLGYVTYEARCSSVRSAY